MTTNTSSAPQFQRGQNVLIECADGWHWGYISGECRGSVHTPALWEVSRSYSSKVYAVTEDLRLSFGDCEYPEEQSRYLSSSEREDLSVKATAMFKLLNAQGVVGHHHMSDRTSYDSLAAKSKVEVLGAAWTSQIKEREQGWTGRYGELVYMTIPFTTRELYDANMADMKQRIIEAATAVGLYVTDAPYGVMITPRYIHEALNADALYKV